MVIQLRPVYDTIVQHATGNGTVVIAPASALGARLANEKLGVPLISVHLQPMALRTLEDQPGVVLPRYAKPLVRPLRKLLLAALDRWVLHPLVLPGLNAFRSELQLAPLEKVFDGWIHSPQMIIGLFPEWFVERHRTGRPSSTRLVFLYTTTLAVNRCRPKSKSFCRPETRLSSSLLVPVCNSPNRSSKPLLKFAVCWGSEAYC